MRESESLFLDLRGLRYHVRRWPGTTGARRVFMLHGWMDVSASFQFLVDALPAEWEVLAPDWRGYGLTERGRSDCYWFPDYLADLDALLDRLQPEVPVDLVGHSLGGNVGALYAGARPARIARFVNLEGLGLSASGAGQAPQRYARWLDELKAGARLRDYDDFAALAARLRAANPRLTPDRADFLSRHWGCETGGRVVLRGDPAHKIVNPVLYRLEESEACWRAVRAPVLWVDAAGSDAPARAGLDAAALAARRACFAQLRHAVVAEAGHMLHHDRPEAVAALIADFLREAPPAG